MDVQYSECPEYRCGFSDEGGSDLEEASAIPMCVCVCVCERERERERERVHNVQYFVIHRGDETHS